jgi:hypothetical protein
VIGVRADADLWSIQAGRAIQTQHRVVHSGPPWLRDRGRKDLEIQVPQNGGY